MDKKLEWKYGRKLFKNNKEKRDKTVIIIFCIASAIAMFSVLLL